MKLNQRTLQALLPTYTSKSISIDFGKIQRDYGFDREGFKKFLDHYKRGVYVPRLHLICIDKFLKEDQDIVTYNY